jgi:hypothetical protein
MTQAETRVGVFWDEQALCPHLHGRHPLLVSIPRAYRPEAVGVFGRPLRRQRRQPGLLRCRIDCSSKRVSQGTYFGFGNFEREPNPTRDLIRVLEQCANGCGANGGIPGLVYRSQDFSQAYNASYLWKGSMSYVTGSHSLKAGYQHTLMTQDITWSTNDQNLTYRFDNGVPNQLTQSISPWMNRSRAAWDAVFAQERWTRGRLTVQTAIRFDRAWSWFPAQQEGPSRFLPVPIIIPETQGVDSYKDISPRMGASYDLFGDGRTGAQGALWPLPGRGLARGACIPPPIRRCDAADDSDAGRRRRDTGMERCQPQLRARLRSAEFRTRRTCARAAATCAASSRSRASVRTC